MIRDTVFASAAAILFCVSLPVLSVSVGRKRSSRLLPLTACVSPTAETSLLQQAEPTEEIQPVADTVRKTAAEPSFDRSFQLPVLLENGVDSLSLHDYLVGALVGEMPLSFDMEALKAQAVACRTYALRQYDSRKHEPAAVCTVSSCCECWVSADSTPDGLRQKAEQAVTETDGLVLTYDGALIEATFFSCSGGRTEAAADVWGNDIPYLMAVDSPGEEQAPHDTGKVTVSLSEFAEKLRAEDSTFTMPEGLSADQFSLTYTQGGGVKTVQVGGATFTGKTFRRLFGLDSTRFTVSVNDQTVIFSTRGYGHRVGMSQYGAQAMAQSGADFRAILEHYYTGTAPTDCRTFYP